MKRVFAVMFGILTIAPAAAQERIHGIAASGKVIAERWCAACHIVSPEQTTGSADLPTFMSIAKAAADDTDPLEAFLADPHPVMPDMSLTRQEIRDLVAYVASLR